MYVCVCACVCVCVRVCVRVCACVCMCVCEREKMSDKEGADRDDGVGVGKVRHASLRACLRVKALGLWRHDPFWFSGSKAESNPTTRPRNASLGFGFLGFWVGDLEGSGFRVQG